MASISVYTLKNCSTCKKATKWLKENNLAFEEIPIRETPPSHEELSLALKAVPKVTRLLNTSSKDYRESNLKNRLAEIDPKELIELLRSNGNLIKRPFLISGQKVVTGFKQAEWEEILLS